MRLRGTRLGAAALATFALTLTAAAPALADDETPGQSQSTSAPSAAQSKALWLATSRVYKAAATNRELTIRAINDAFTKSVKRAKKDFSEALDRATTPAQKSAATARFKDAIDRATALRKAALDALPKLPPSPGASPASVGK